MSIKITKKNCCAPCVPEPEFGQIWTVKDSMDEEHFCILSKVLYTTDKNYTFVILKTGEGWCGPDTLKNIVKRKGHRYIAPNLAAFLKEYNVEEC